MSVKSSKASKPASNDKTASDGSRRDFDRLMAEAKKIPAGEVQPLRTDVHLAVTNAQIGIGEVLAHAKRLRRELPGVSIAAIEGLPAGPRR